MHVLGKVCTWLLVPLVIAGVVLAGQAVNIRSSWTKKADKLQVENAELAAKIVQKEDRLNDLRNQRSLLERSWGRFFTSDNVTVSDPQQGIISTNIGTRQGLQIAGQEGLPILFGFYVPENGQQRYIGPFQVIDARDDSSSLQLTKYPRPNDIATWQQGSWRFWRFIPTEYSNRHDTLWNTLVSTEEHLNHVEDAKRETTAQKTRAQEQIDERVSELEGGNQIPMGIKGLVESLEVAEQERDEQLFKVDQLRKQIFGAQEQLQQLIEKSHDLMRQLPKPYLDTAEKPEPGKN